MGEKDFCFLFNALPCAPGFPGAVDLVLSQVHFNCNVVGRFKKIRLCVAFFGADCFLALVRQCRASFAFLSLVSLSRITRGNRRHVSKSAMKSSHLAVAISGKIFFYCTNLGGSADLELKCSQLRKPIAEKPLWSSPILSYVGMYMWCNRLGENKTCTGTSEGLKMRFRCSPPGRESSGLFATGNLTGLILSTECSEYPEISMISRLHLATGNVYLLLSRAM